MPYDLVLNTPTAKNMIVTISDKPEKIHKFNMNTIALI